MFIYNLLNFVIIIFYIKFQIPNSEKKKKKIGKWNGMV